VGFPPPRELGSLIVGHLDDVGDDALGRSVGVNVRDSGSAGKFGAALVAVVVDVFDEGREVELHIGPDANVNQIAFGGNVPASKNA
jgi:hypothetical protein